MEIRSHSQDVLVPVDNWYFNVHHGNDGIDITSDECSPSDFAAVKTAASVSQTAFDSAASTAWGTKFDNLSMAQKALLRGNAQRFP